MSVLPSPSKGGFAVVLATSLFALGPGMLSAEAPGAFEDVQWTRAPDGIGFDYAWTAKPNRYYFIEQSPDLSAESWSFFPYAVKGDGGSEGLFLNPSSDRFFLRLRYTDSTDDPLLLEDFNASGFSNRVELDAGGNPFNMPDADGNGVPDSIDAFWANEVPDAWKQALPNDPNKAFYDPDHTVTALADVKPGDDYDGDGRSNLREYLDGTDPADFFNGQPARLQMKMGFGQTAAPDRFLDIPFVLEVLGEDGEPVGGAPVRFSTEDGRAALGIFHDKDALSPAMVRRSMDSGLVLVRYATAEAIGDELVTASLPNGNSLGIVVHTVGPSAKAKAPLREFRSVQNPDGTTTYSWVSDADPGDWFRIETENPDGTYSPVYETHYGADDLPFVPGENSYSLTIAE